MPQTPDQPDFTHFHQLFAGAQNGHERTALDQARQLYAESPKSREIIGLSPEQFIQNPTMKSRMNQLLSCYVLHLTGTRHCG